MKIIQDHWCPNCRVMQTEWRIPTAMTKRTMRPGDAWPNTEPVIADAVDICEACNTEIKGKVLIRLNENGDPERLIGVKELEV